MQIWTAWLQGRKNAPSHVRKIFDLWQTLNPQDNLVVLEEAEIQTILRDVGVSDNRLSPQVKTDIARTYLLAHKGGVWVDSTLLPTRPLDSWLNAELKAGGLFAFRSSGHPALVLQNWFLYSEQDNPLMRAWLDFYCDYFRLRRFLAGSRRILLSPHIFDIFRHGWAVKRRDFEFFVDPDRGRSCRMYPYAIHNYCLFYLLRRDPALARIWENVPKRYHAQPSVVGCFAGDTETCDEVFFELALELIAHAPVHKLNHRDKRFASLIDEAVTKGFVSA